jgi:hypothetical protein
MLAVVVTALVPAAAAADSPTTTSTCDTGPFTQPFLSAKDSNWYTLMGGQTPGDFDGGGWTLTGGATIVPTQMGDGTDGHVLDMPSGSTAVSPTTCVTHEFPTSRMMVRNVRGSEGVFFYVSYLGTKTWTNPKNTGQVHGKGTGWTLSDPVNLQPYSDPGWQTVRITLKAGGNSSRFQVYDVYVDPRMK